MQMQVQMRAQIHLQLQVQMQVHMQVRMQVQMQVQMQLQTLRFDSIRFASDRKQWNCYLIMATDGMSIDR